jgi:tetratricopeptide (TPR) repeat protein
MFDPNDSMALNNYANKLEGTQCYDYIKADSFYRRALEHDPLNTDTLFNYVKFVENKMLDHVRAEELCRELLTIDPNHVPGLVCCAKLIWSKPGGKHPLNARASENMFLEAIRIDPNSALAMDQYGMMIANVKYDYGAAEAMFKRALEADPNYGHALGNYAKMSADINQDYIKAKSLYERLLAVDPSNASAKILYQELLLNVANLDNSSSKSRMVKKLHEKQHSAKINEQNKLDCLISQSVLESNQKHAELELLLLLDAEENKKGSKSAKKQNKKKAK